MSSLLNSYSKFYYGHTVDDTNYTIDFKEGAGAQITAELNPGAYTLTEYAVEVARAMNDVGGQTYSVAVDRPTRKLTISAAGAFTLLVSTGTTVGDTAFTMAGFTGSDTSSATSHQGNNGSGSEYAPQFMLQSYVPTDNWQQAADVTVNKTASGSVEVVKFGSEKFLQFQIMFATDISQGDGPIKTDVAALANLQAFMQYLITKSAIEFIPDVDHTSTFQSVLLESAPESNTGTGYLLHEMYDKGLPGYFSTSVLKFRLLE